MVVRKFTCTCSTLRSLFPDPNVRWQNVRCSFQNYLQHVKVWKKDLLIMYLVNWDFRDLMYFIWEVKVKEINYLDCWCLFVTSVPWPLKLWSLFVLKLNIMTMFGINPLLVSSSNAYQINVFNVGDQYYKTRNRRYCL